MAVYSLLMLFFAACAHGAEFVPVYMWGATVRDSVKNNALSKLDSSDFQQILGDQLASKPFTVVFIEENLSLEDLSSKGVDKRTVYPGLSERNKEGSAVFYPFVAPIMDAVDAAADPDRVDRVKFTADGLSAEIQPTDGNFLYVSMEDARDGESRSDMLHRHDEFMFELFEKLKTKHDRVLAIYTSRNPSWMTPEEIIYDPEEVSAVRTRRNLLQAAANADEAIFINASSRAMLYVSRIVLTTAGNNQAVNLTTPSATTAETPSADEIVMRVTFPQNQINFDFIRRNGYWYLDHVNVSLNNEVEQLYSRKIFAEDGFSYHCSKTITLSGDNNTLTLMDFQVQAFFGNTPSQKFGSAADCVGFTTVPIWMGLFVVAIMLIILFIGIAMMMDIRTMDRFDDPKGKTITINAGE